MLDELSDAAVDAVLSAAGPGSRSGLGMVELRHLGGALARPHPAAGALPFLSGDFLLFAAGLSPTADEVARVYADAAALKRALAGHLNGNQVLNFSEQRVDPRTGFPAESWSRLRSIRSTVDPHGLFLANHVIPPTT
jgi:FAD/FMN-containing dehydrogenase